MRKLPLALGASALLGLPAALLAHAGAFRGSHVLGGQSHALFLACGALATTAILTLCIVVASRQRWSSNASSGIATLASPGMLILSASCWFIVIEASEAPHAIAVLPITLTIALAACLLHFGLSSFERVAGALVLEFCTKLPVIGSGWTARAFQLEPCAVASGPRAYRRFSRPPPAIS